MVDAPVLALPGTAIVTKAAVLLCSAATYRKTLVVWNAREGIAGGK